MVNSNKANKRFRTLLRKKNFDERLMNRLKKLSRFPAMDVLKLHEKKFNKIAGYSKPAVALVYEKKEEFQLAGQKLQIMTDFKSGIPRGAYKGVVSTIYNDTQVYLTPVDPNTHIYNVNW